MTRIFFFRAAIYLCMPGVGLMVRLFVLGSEGPEFKSRFAVELTPGGVDWACHPSEVGEMSTSVLVIGALYQQYSCSLSHPKEEEEEDGRSDGNIQWQKKDSNTVLDVICFSFSLKHKHHKHVNFQGSLCRLFLVLQLYLVVVEIFSNLFIHFLPLSPNWAKGYCRHRRCPVVRPGVCQLLVSVNFEENALSD